MSPFSVMAVHVLPLSADCSQRKVTSSQDAFTERAARLDRPVSCFLGCCRNSRTKACTALEYRIFSLLVQNQGKVVTRELVLEKIWDIAGNYVNDNTLTVYIKRIRKKLSSDIIKTVKGLGYMLEDRG